MAHRSGVGSGGSGIDPEPRPPSDDIGWRFGAMVGNSRSKARCIFCGKVISGGITRLKEHLAHKRGQVSSCSSVSGEVRELMMAHLLDYKDKQIDKRKRNEELVEQIRATQVDDEDVEYNQSDDSDDPQMALARQQSLRSHYEYEERERFKHQMGSTYHVGGSSGAASGRDRVEMRAPSGFPHVGGSSRAASGRDRVEMRAPPGFPQPQRCSNLRETNTTAWTDSTSPAARLASIEVDLHRSKGKKQPKLSTKFLKAAKKKLGRAVSQFVLYTRLPINTVNSPWFQPMLDVAREVGQGTKLPSTYEVSEVYLVQEYDSIQKWIETLKPSWAERGVTIMCDGWSGTGRRHIVNFLVYSNRGTIFHKSIDATDVVSRTADYYFHLMDKVVDEIGEEYVVQIVTDNEAAMKAAGRKLMEKRPSLYWTACAAHCIDLILEDIGKKKSVQAVLEDAKKITRFIYNYDWVVSYMKNFTEGRELLRPVITRFATNFITLESLVRHKSGLKEMFNSADWKSTRYARMNAAKEARDIIESKNFWAKAADILKVQEPLVKVLRLVDGDKKPTMGFIYEAMDRAKLAIKNNCRHYDNYLRIIDNRWDFQLHADLHAAGYFLNPIFQYGPNFSNHGRVMEGLRNVITKLLSNLDEQVEAINQISMFRNKEEHFGSMLAQRAIHSTNPAEWWIHYGDSAPALQKVAVKVLSQTTSSSNCERNWSTFSLIHTKTRNRLKYQKLNKIVYTYYNMRLKIRHATRRTEEEIDEHFNPINLDYIFDEDDPLAPWLQEREHAILDDGDNSEWLHDSGDEQNPQGVDLSGNSSSVGRGLSSSSGGDDNDGGLGNRENEFNQAEEDDSIREFTRQQRRHSISSADAAESSRGNRRRSRPLNDLYGDRNLGDQFGHLRIGQDHRQPTPYSYYPSQEQQPYLNQPLPPFMGMGNPHQSYQYPYSESSSYGSNTACGAPTHGYSQQESGSSGTINNFDHCNFTSNYYGLFGGGGQNSYGATNEDEEYVEPPRNSFWW